jgi:hypothetical protein
VPPAFGQRDAGIRAAARQRRRDLRRRGPTPLRALLAARRARGQSQRASLAVARGYNTKWTHQGRGMSGRTPAKAVRDGIPRPNKKADKTDLKIAA